MAIAFINSTKLDVTVAASTWSIPTSTLNGGAALIVGVGLAGSSSIQVTAMTDNTPNVYTLMSSRASSGSTITAELWASRGISSASTRISFTLSGASSGGVAVAQFTGISTAGGFPNVKGSSANAVTSTTISAAKVTPSTEGLAIGFARMNASTFGTITAGAGYTAWASTSATGVQRCFGEYRIDATPTTASHPFATSSRTFYNCVLAYLSDTVAVAVGGGSWPPRMLMMGLG